MDTRTFIFLTLLLITSLVKAEDPYHFFEWKITYGTMSPLGIPQQVILINDKFPGPVINCTSNNNIVVNVFNHLDEPFLLTWNGVQQRKNSWVDGTPGTMCPIQPGTNFTYKFQVKDQIGSYYYFPTTAIHKAAGGIGMIQVHSRPLIPVPFDNPADEFAVIVGDWFKKGHKSMKSLLDSGKSIGRPDGLHINGKSAQVGGPAEPSWTFEAGKTYRFRFCNVGMRTSVNFRFQGHDMKLVELEGSHLMQNEYMSIDLHVGQCMSVLVTADQPPKDYYLVVSSRFTKDPYSTVATIRYKGSNAPASSELPPPPPGNTAGIAWSINQFRSYRWNLTASAARPNPQGSYHYGQINITRTIKMVNSRNYIDGKLRFAFNGVSHVDPKTPLKLLEYYGVADKEFKYNSIPDEPPPDVEKNAKITPNVLNATYRNFVEIIFENRENTIQTYHLDGYSFFAVAVEPGRWSPEKRKNYNLEDAISRHNVAVFPGCWAAVMLTLDNAGMWSPEKRKNYNLEDAISRHNVAVFPGCWAAVMLTLDNAGMWSLRSEMWERFYLGQQLYISVLSPERSLRDEYSLPETTQLCGIVTNMPKPQGYV